MQAAFDAIVHWSLWFRIAAALLLSLAGVAIAMQLRWRALERRARADYLHSHDTLPKGSVALLLPSLVRPLIARRLFSFIAGIAATVAIALGFAPKTTALSYPVLTYPHPPSTNLLIVLHGWRGSGAGTWRRFPDLLDHDPRLDSCDVMVVDYPAFAMRRSLSVDETADWLYNGLHTNLRLSSYHRIVILAHSMGGLIARELCLIDKRGRADMNIVHLVEIASPHEGANVARLANALGISRDLTADLAPQSRFLRSLRLEWNGLTARPSTMAFTSYNDNVVPESSARSQCDHFEIYPQWGHNEMVSPDSLRDPRYDHPVADLLIYLRH